jgi:hypothetical protein
MFVLFYYGDKSNKGVHMAYQKSLDKEIASWAKEPEDSESNLYVSVMQYNDGERKVQIGPRSSTLKSGKVRYNKAGRLNADEIAWLVTILDQVEDVVNTEDSIPESLPDSE